MAKAPTTERELVALLQIALAPVPVHWGFAPFEAAAVPPTLPLVVVQRLNYATTGYEDMCTEAAYLGDTTITIHSWSLGYEEGRVLCDRVRGAMADATGWRLQEETDAWEPAFRAWVIAGTWLAAGVAPS